VVDRLLVDVESGGALSVSMVLADGDLPAVVSSGSVVEPGLTPDELKELRWYLEDYLRVPFGVYADRGEQIVRRLSGWGQSMFTSVFGAGPARDAYIGLRSRTGARDAVEIVVRSASPGWLGLPWELMADPGRPAALVLDGVSLSRSVPSAPIGTTFNVEGDRLRVLMVIARPRGAADVGYRMIARHLMSRLELVEGKVEVVVLRPPTLDALKTTLHQGREAGNPFQIVHFDGHGALTRAETRPPGSVAQPDEGSGVLVFEKPAGGDDPVPTEQIAEALAAGQVPVVVLNACQSGAIGKQLEATVATRLLAGGASAVVAMAYSVYAVAAAEFMTAFYERLFAGASITDAVAAGRARMHQRPARPSPKGELPLQDWLIPVHYLRKEVRFPHLRRDPHARPTGISVTDALDQLRQLHTDDTPDQTSTGDALKPVSDFVGRDGLFYTLEVAARAQHVILLYGPGGIGKTELAKAFGRWWQHTGGVDDPDWVIWHSFEPGVASFGLNGVLDTIGFQVWGTEFFARTESTQRRPLVERFLQQHRLLLILDNFETVHTLPDPTNATPPLDQAARTELHEFLRTIATNSSSTILITSRTPERWLGQHIRRIAVGGLTPEEADAYTDQLLAPYPAAQPRRAQPAFRDLLEWLDGHPLTMRLTLPHLDRTNPSAVLANLQGITAPHDHQPGPDADRNSSLAASIAYSLTHLDTTDQHLLHVVALFHGVADVNALITFSKDDHIPQRFRGIDRKRWAAMLDRAADVGLLTPIGADLYAIPPALPVELTRHWHRHHPDTFDTEYAHTQRALLDALAGFGSWAYGQISTGDAGLAYSLIAHQRRSLGHYLGYALDHHHWEKAQAIAQALDSYWERSGLTVEADAWTDRALNALETPDGAPPPLDQPAGALWQFFTVAQANRQTIAGRLDAAEATYTRVHHALQQQPDSRKKQLGLGIMYHQLSTLAQTRGDLDAAEDWCRRSETILVQLNEQSRLAVTYQQFGAIAQQRGKLAAAEDWYRQSQTVLEQHDDPSRLALTYHRLGVVAQLREDFDDAEDWYRKSQTIRMQLNDQPRLGETYYQLGRVAQERGNLDAAEDWYRQSLTAAQKFSDQPGLAATYGQLGIVAQLREDFDDAEDWYRKSLTIRERLGSKPGLALSYGQLGVLAGERGDLAQALHWLVRCVTVFDQFPHPATGAGPLNFATLAALVGMPAVERVWMQVTGTTLPQHVREFIRQQN
jgi:tetratricopeptide (TPR) repeat protein